MASETDVKPLVLVNARYLGEEATGYGQYTRQLFHSLATYGVDFEYVFAAPTALAEADATDLPERVRVAVTPWAALPSRGGRAAAWDLVAFPRLARRLRPAVVHHLMPCITPALGLPTVTTVHDTIPQHFPRSRLRSLYQREALRRALCSEVVCVVTKAARDQLSTDTRLPLGKAVVVPHGRNPAYIGRQHLPLPKTGAFSELHEHPYFVYLGNDHPHKNLPGLLAGFGRLGTMVPECRLALCGQPFRAPRWRALGPGVVPVGPVTEEEKVALYQGAVGLVLPSLAEGFGLPVLEALTLGCPVVASDLPAVREVAGSCAVFFDPGDPSSMTCALLKVLRESDLAENLRRRGRGQAARFQWSAAVAQLEDAYRRAQREAAARA